MIEKYYKKLKTSPFNTLRCGFEVCSTKHENYSFFKLFELLSFRQQEKRK